MTLIIDLKTRTLPDDPGVFMVRPGAAYHLYNAVLTHEAIVADAPFLETLDGEPMPEAPSNSPMYERARVLRVWAGKSGRKRGPMPTLQMESYKTFLEDRGPKMARTKLRNAANKLFWDIPDRSLLYIPSSTLSGNAMLAEAAPRTDARRIVEGSGSRRGMKYLARPILNPKRVPMRHLPAEVTETSQKLLVHNQFDGYAKERLLRAYYGDYQRGRSTMVVEFVAGAQEFDSKVLAQMTALAISIEHFNKTREYISPKEILFGHPELRGPSLHARINSPDGAAQVETKTLAPHMVKAFLIGALSVYTVDQIAEAFQGDLAIENSSLQDGEDIVRATEGSLINYAKSAGVADIGEVIGSLRESVNVTDGEVSGSAQLAE